MAYANDSTVPIKTANKRMTAEFNEQIKGVEDDEFEKRKRFNDVYQDLEEWGLLQKEPGNARRTAAKQVRDATKQFTNLVSELHPSNRLLADAEQACAYSTLEDMVVGGFVAYLGPEANSKARSSFFASSDLLCRLIDKQEPNLNKLMEVIIVSCK